MDECPLPSILESPWYTVNVDHLVWATMSCALYFYKMRSVLIKNSWVLSIIVIFSTWWKQCRANVTEHWLLRIFFCRLCNLILKFSSKSNFVMNSKFHCSIFLISYKTWYLAIPCIGLLAWGLFEYLLWSMTQKEHTIRYRLVRFRVDTEVQ